MREIDKNFEITLIGETLAKIINANGSGEDRIIFETKSGKSYLMYHSQDCCESVVIHDIKGNLDDLLDTPITEASEQITNEPPEDVVSSKDHYSDESCTWTTFTLGTSKGRVVIRWHGSSNGYYSESVSFVEN